MVYIFEAESRNSLRLKINVDKGDVLESIRKLQRGKSCGVDKIPNEFIKSLPLEEQPGYDADKDPNLLRRIKYYQGESLGADFDRAIALEDEELKKLGRDPANILQRNRNVNPLVPKRATTKQMQELKGKIDKYKNNHFPKEKPFKKPTLKDRPVRKPNAVPPKTNTIKMAPLPPINFDLISL